MSSTDDASPSVRRQGARLYFAGSIVAQVAALVRYVVMARILGPEQLGMAATLVVTSAFFDLVTDTGGDRFVIQDRNGDDPPVQSMVQLVYVVRGAVVGLILALFATPLAAFYKTPALAFGFVVLGLVPFIGGFLNLDIRRVQRRSDFRPEAWCMMVSEICSLVATAAAAWLTRSFTAIIWGLMARAIAMTILSHLLAKRRYRVGWSRKDAPRFLHFALPLMLNGFMLFVGSQGDRVMVARELGSSGIGHYQAVILLIFYPSALLQRYMHVVFLPLIASARDDDTKRMEVVELMGGLTFLLALAMAAGCALVAPLAVPILYGKRFAVTALIAGLMGVLQTTRFLINWPTTVNLALGHSRAVLVSSIAKLMVFPGAYLGFHLIGGIAGVVIGFTGGELISIFVGVALMDWHLGRTWSFGFDRLAYFGLAAAAMVGFGLAQQWGSGSMSLVMTSLSACLIVWILRREAATLASVISVGRRYARPWLLKFGVTT